MIDLFARFVVFVVGLTAFAIVVALSAPLIVFAGIYVLCSECVKLLTRKRVA